MRLSDVFYEQEIIKNNQEAATYCRGKVAGFREALQILHELKDEE